jgi:hypothetical protein
MANKKISELTNINNPNLSAITPVVVNNITYKTSLQNLRQVLVDNGSHNFTGSQNINGNLVISGSLTAQQYIISSSLINIITENISGSTSFGNTEDDTHKFTGSVFIKGNLNVTDTGSMKNLIVGFGEFNQSNPEVLHAESSGSFNIADFKGDFASYAQINLKNKNSGNVASGDVVITADNGTEEIHYVDLGINSSTYDAGYVGYENDAYLINAGKDLYLGTIGGIEEHPSKVHLFTNNSWEDSQIVIHPSKQIGFNTGSVTTGYTYEFSGSLKLQNELNVEGSVTASYFIGDGSLLTNLPSTSIYSEGTYDEIYSLYTGSTLVPGTFYLMTDYQTCYDQPNYNNVKSPIYTGNYMTGNTEPILLLATSTTGFSPTVHSTLYPKDKITYDITWNTTEVTNSPAKGRITERIDEFNNRTDYDHKSILFKRYNGYSYRENQPLAGVVGISGITGTTAVLYGNTGTTFNSNFSQGSIIAIQNISPSFFEIISVASDSLAIISGTSISETIHSSYYTAMSDGVMSYYQPNIRQSEVFEYTTFGDAIDNIGAVNNYIGDYSNLYSLNEPPFILANNVFINGSFKNNKIGDNSYNNTFNDDCDNNEIGHSFYNNSTNNDFDGNVIGERFNNNYITADFDNNRIGTDFNNNILLGGILYRNNIGNDFNFNVWTIGDFQNNEIGNQFQNNNIYDSFYKNDIGNGYNNNDIYWDFYGNLIGNGYNVNTIYSEFRDNIVGDYFNNNTIGDVTNIGGNSFYGNRIGYRFEDNIIRNYFNDNDILNDFNNNTIYYTLGRNKILNDFNQNTIGSTGNTSNTFEHNQIMHNFDANNIQGSFLSNNIKKEFKGNEILGDFNDNNLGSHFAINNISGSTIYNNIGDYFRYNNCYGDFMYNTIGVGFDSNEIDDGFGVGYGDAQGNRIGNHFYDNSIGEYFYNNTIPDNFTGNTIGDYYQWNVVNTNIGSIDFTTNYGNITGFSYASMGYSANDDTYTGVTSQTNGNGISATFDIVVSGGSVTNLTLNASGRLYLSGDTVTILGTTIGGLNNAIFSFTDNVTTQTGLTGNYSGLTVTGGTGSGATFDVVVSGGSVTNVTIVNQGFGYLDGEQLVIKGNLFGGTDGVDDITITISDIISDNITISIDGVSQKPSVYEPYTCNIFKNSGLINRLSYYDETDTLIIDNINE